MVAASVLFRILIYFNLFPWRIRREEIEGREMKRERGRESVRVRRGKSEVIGQESDCLKEGWAENSRKRSGMYKWERKGNSPLTHLRVD